MIEDITHTIENPILSEKYHDMNAVELSKRFLMSDIDSRPIYFYDSPQLVSQHPEFIKTQSLLLISIPAYEKFSNEHANILNFRREIIDNKRVNVSTDYPCTITPLVEQYVNVQENATDKELIASMKNMGHIQSAQKLSDYIHNTEKSGDSLGIHSEERKIIEQFKNKELKEFLEQFPAILRADDKKALTDFATHLSQKIHDFSEVAFGAAINMIQASKLKAVVDKNEFTEETVNKAVEIIAHTINESEAVGKYKREILIYQITGDTGSEDLKPKKQWKNWTSQ